MVSSGLLTSQQYSYQFITLYGYRDAINRHSQSNPLPRISQPALNLNLNNNKSEPLYGIRFYYNISSCI